MKEIIEIECGGREDMRDRRHPADRVRNQDNGWLLCMNEAVSLGHINTTSVHARSIAGGAKHVRLQMEPMFEYTV